MKKIKSLLLLTAFTAATAFTANAATDAVSVSGPTTSFNGFYLGAQGGWVKSKTKVTITDEKYAAARKTYYDQPANFSKNNSGFLGGTYFGYGRNFGGFYVGAEASILFDTTNRKASASGVDTTGIATFTDTVSIKRGIVFGLAPRFGFAFGNNLVYIKTGIELSREKLQGNAAASPLGNTVLDAEYSNSSTKATFTPEFGYERAFGKFLARAAVSYNAGTKYSIQKDSSYGPVTELAKASYSDYRLSVGIAYKF